MKLASHALFDGCRDLTADGLGFVQAGTDEVHHVVREVAPGLSKISPTPNVPQFSVVIYTEVSPCLGGRLCPAARRQLQYLTKQQVYSMLDHHALPTSDRIQKSNKGGPL
jgi:hypothetical protein